MYSEPDIERLLKLDTSGLKLKDSLIFCPDCDWQAPEPNIGMRSVCPECKGWVYLKVVDQELLDL